MPYPGFWAKWDMADMFALMPFAQFVRREYQNRVKIGWDDKNQWLTIPVDAEYKEAICNVKIGSTYNGEKMCRTLEYVYGKEPFWTKYGWRLLAAFSGTKPGKDLYDLNRNLIDWMRVEMDVWPEATERLALEDEPASAALARWTVSEGCDTYVSGQGGLGYMDMGEFDAAGVKVETLEPRIAKGFRTVSGISVLLRHGPDWRKVLE